MILVAITVTAIITLLELLVIPSVPSSQGLAMLVVGANSAIALLVAYFMFASIRVPGRGGAQPAEAMRVVQDTLPLVRRGLNPESASRAARVMASLSGVGAAVVADRSGLLAFEGADSVKEALGAHHDRLLKALGRKSQGTVRVGACWLAAAPLRARENVIGGLGLVAPTGQGEKAARDLQQFSSILAQLLAMQVELGQLDRQAQLVAEAELNALRAQINPHFLFNALNTIISYSRDDPETTRRLLLRLSDLFRGTMQSSGQVVPFAEEYEHLKNYLFIEQARFRDKLKVTYDIDPQVLKVRIPALSVQPLVENAVRHGITPKTGLGMVDVTARLDFVSMRVVITVKDDGVGMAPERVEELLQPRQQQAVGGVGLSNIHERLKRLYGPKYSLTIDSKEGKGTTVFLRIPMR